MRKPTWVRCCMQLITRLDGVCSRPRVLAGVGRLAAGAGRNGRDAGDC